MAFVAEDRRPSEDAGLRKDRDFLTPTTTMAKRTITLMTLGAVILLTAPAVIAQDLQLHYDLRHTVDPRNNARNFPEITFKSFKALELGSFLFKLEADLDGTQHNISKGYMEVSQTVRLWNAPVYALGEFTGGAGLLDGASGGYYVENAYLLGLAHPFAWRGNWGSAALAYRHANFRRPSHDAQATLYWGAPFLDRFLLSSTGIFWTANRNHGDDYTAALDGKQRSFLVENELWWRASALVSLGSELRISRNVYASDGRTLVYPTVGVRYAF